MISEIQGVPLEMIVSGQINIADPFVVWAFIPAEIEEAPNTINVRNLLAFQRRGIAPEFDIGWRNSTPRKLGRKTGWA
jgi:hypothetical protein